MRVTVAGAVLVAIVISNAACWSIKGSDEAILVEYCRVDDGRIADIAFWAGRLYLGTSQGLFTTTLSAAARQQPIAIVGHASVRRLVTCEDCLLVCSSSGCFRFDGERWQQLTASSVHDCAFVGKELWCALDEGLVVVVPEQRKLEVPTMTDYPATRRVRAMVAGAGKVWLGSQHGLHHRDVAGHWHYAHGDEEYSLSGFTAIRPGQGGICGSYVRRLVLHDDRLYAATNRGCSCLSPRGADSLVGRHGIYGMEHERLCWQPRQSNLPVETAVVNDCVPHGRTLVLATPEGLVLISHGQHTVVAPGNDFRAAIVVNGLVVVATEDRVFALKWRSSDRPPSV